MTDKLTQHSAKAALITGAAKRIGAKLAMLLAKRGYDIVLHYHNSEEPALQLQQHIKNSFKVNCHILKADLTCVKEIAGLAKKVPDILPNWSLLINNASNFNQSDILNIKAEELMDSFNLHLTTSLLLTQSFAEHCGKTAINGNIINMVDKNITRFRTKYFAYLLNKKFLAEFTKMAAIRLAPQIRVNAIAPDFIEASDDQKLANWEINNLPAKNPLQRPANINHVIQTVEYLLDNDYINGQVLFIDGASSLINC